MKITEAAAVLRPGTSWVGYTDDKGNQTLIQAVDGSLRVSIPTKLELQSILDSENQKEMVRDAKKTAARSTIRDTLQPLSDRLNALILLLNLDV